jgi:hypothetical protein
MTAGSLILTYPSVEQPPAQGEVSCSELPKHLKLVVDYLQTVHQQQHQSQLLLSQTLPLSLPVVQLHNTYNLENYITM